MLHEPRWYHEPWAVGVACILVPPLGFLLLWLSVEVSFRWKLTLSTMLVAVVTGAGLFEWYEGSLSWAFRSLAAEACRAAGDALSDDGRLLEAEGRFREAVELLPTKPWPHVNLGVCLRRRKRVGEALASFSTARGLALDALADHEHGFVRASLEMAGLFMDEGRMNAAQSVMDEMHKRSRYPLATVPRYRLVRARMFIGRKDWSAARKELRQLVDELQTDWLGEAYERMAEVAAGEGDTRCELYFLCEALRYREGEAELEGRIVAAAGRWGRQQTAVGTYVRAMRTRRVPEGAAATVRVLLAIVDDCPDFVFADGCLYTAAYCTYTHEGDYHRAAKLYERVADEHPRSESFGKALWQAADCYRQIGLPRHRERALKRMVAGLEPSSVLYGRARSALRRDRRQAERRHERERRS